MSYENYHRFLQALAAAVQDEADADAQVAFTGLRGTGKSTFTLGATMRLEKYLGGDWSLEQNVLWTYREILRGLTDESPAHAISIDEAVLVALNRNFGKSWQKKLVQLLNTAREYHKVSFWNIPLFRRMDPGVREQFQYWVWIPRRGEALVFQRSVNPAAKDPWNLDYMEWYIRQRTKNDWNVDEVVEAAMEVPNFSMHFKFPKIDESLRKQYKEIAKKMKKKLDADDGENEENNAKKLLGLKFFVVDGRKYFLAFPYAKFLTAQHNVPERTLHSWINSSQYITKMVINGSVRKVVPEDYVLGFSAELAKRVTQWLKRTEPSDVAAAVVAP